MLPAVALLMDFSILLQFYFTPAAVQAAAKSAVQISDTFQKPSAITVVSTLSLVTATGVSKMEGTSMLPLLIVASHHGGRHG